MKAIIGRKIGMSQIVNEDGVVVPVTLVQAGPCTVVGVRTEEKDGYSAVALGFETAKHPNKAQVGQTKKAGTTPKVVREFEATEADVQEVGTVLDVTTFELGDVIAVSGISKGKGFAGTIKRHNFARGPMTHGSRNIRKPGSIGSMYPQKIYKGRKLPGQMGVAKVTTKNQKVALVDKEHNVIGVHGAVPGARGSLVTIVGGAA